MSEKQSNLANTIMFAVFGILVSVCGFLIVDKLNGIEKKFERQSLQIENLSSQLNKEMHERELRDKDHDNEIKLLKK